ncbi:UDP-N-acetylglucosamine--N-acetylmuramyl-(pentapeptide) pyrophosphoryl-undecaprenol N-acetylglucosamine transferase [Candidatus Saccharibacteria bacterium]|nr:UDP-N-acetylglucosamine--N-acetylmuramyl-(pentapeptide) pyrophosphoryl-undecaprenol N-acetylglucosamine transferase [Candidatus Saccharibacteria bacterium]
MKILSVGGGSGGHVTPVVAVLKELRALKPEAELRFWCDTKFAPQARATVEAFDATIPVQTITAGKFRRYYHLTVFQQLTWPSLVLQNLGDAFKVGIGFIQSFFKLIVWRPDVVFTKGGYVCLPVGLAAHILRIPLVIHDSDAHPGLTNRVLSKWATAIGTGAPLEYYPYPKHKTHYVGIPIASEFHPYTKVEQVAAKKEWGINPSRPLVVVTGGGLGAARINQVVANTLTTLQQNSSVILVAGAGQYDELRSLMPADNDAFQLYPFVTNMHSLLGAADVVVTRAGATTILELAALEKPTILIPNGKLTGGHQLKNAAVYEKARAAVIIDEEVLDGDNDLLGREIKRILDTSKETTAMAQRFATFSKPHAAKDMARLILAAPRS